MTFACQCLQHAFDICAICTSDLTWLFGVGSARIKRSELQQHRFSCAFGCFRTGKQLMTEIQMFLPAAGCPPRLTTAACCQSSTRRTASSRMSPPPYRMPATLWQTAYLRRATPPARHRSPPQTAPRALCSEHPGCGPSTAVF